MKKCYKCRKPYMEPNGPGFQDACEGCQSYLHCCQNCNFFDLNQHNNCAESQAEYVSDGNGMNHCEYFRFKTDGGGRKLADDDGGRRFRKADWRNLNKDRAPGRGKAGAGRSGGGLFKDGSRPASRGAKAQKAREALDNLFKKE